MYIELPSTPMAVAFFSSKSSQARKEKEIGQGTIRRGQWNQ